MSSHLRHPLGDAAESSGTRTSATAMLTWEFVRSQYLVAALVGDMTELSATNDARRHPLLAQAGPEGPAYRPSE
ncbi:hypothetical protein FB564_3590 [Salinispora arenicola]|uniref:Uncharacterized protein n=1 Tax=Salinispora arenicola TaxID=168697 RepID=A0A542XRF3_SALAC|nr:hypothetical protein FB564_3590 [Salinispora arenicola]